jgi:hypothetical protein
MVIFEPPCVGKDRLFRRRQDEERPPSPAGQRRATVRAGWQSLSMSLIVLTEPQHDLDHLDLVAAEVMPLLD